MSDIPDWLVELAAQRDDDEETATLDSEVVEVSPDGVHDEWRFLRDAPSPTEDAVTTAGDSTPAVGTVPLREGDADEGEVIDVLRGQVEADAIAADARDAAPKSAPSRRIAGLLPWQQVVLAILLLLDIAVVGFLFLVMLGKIAIG